MGIFLMLILIIASALVLYWIRTWSKVRRIREEIIKSWDDWR